MGRYAPYDLSYAQSLIYYTIGTMKKVKQKKDYTNHMWPAEVAFDKGSETPAPHFKVKGVTIINGKEYIVLDV